MDYKEAIEWIKAEYVEKPDGIKDGIIDTGLAFAMTLIEERIALIECALEIACKEYHDHTAHVNFKCVGDVLVKYVDYFIQQARAELAKEKGDG